MYLKNFNKVISDWHWERKWITKKWNTKTEKSDRSSNENNLIGI